MNGGVIDCDADKGKRTGPGMTINTNFLITGEAPNEKTPGEDMNLRTNMFKDAERLGVRVISLSDLKQQMGYHNSVEVKHYGSRSGASDQKAAKAPAASGDAAAPAPRKKAPAAAPADE